MMNLNQYAEETVRSQASAFVGKHDRSYGRGIFVAHSAIHGYLVLDGGNVIASTESLSEADDWAKFLSTDATLEV